MAKSAPLYVHAACDHGCGYSEPVAWIEKFETDPNATFALAVAAFTLGLVGMGVWTNCLTLAQLRLGREQVRLGRDEFNATHRPKIITRSFEPATRDGKTSVAFVFVNIGAGEAKIVEIGSCVSDNSNPGKIFVVEHGAFPIFLASGESHQWFIVDDHIANYVGTYIDPSTAVSGGFLIGYIEYIDAAGRKRETGFCRKFNTENNRWVRQTESELEYED